MSDSQDDELKCPVIDAVDDAIVTNSNAPAVDASGKLGDAGWARNFCKRKQSPIDARPDTRRELAPLALGGR